MAAYGSRGENTSPGYAAEAEGQENPPAVLLPLAGPAALTHGVIGAHIVEFSTVVVCPVGHTMHVGGVVAVPGTEM